jgi:hypothetical protein
MIYHSLDQTIASGDIDLIVAEIPCFRTSENRHVSMIDNFSWAER